MSNKHLKVESPATLRKWQGCWKSAGLLKIHGRSLFSRAGLMVDWVHFCTPEPATGNCRLRPRFCPSFLLAFIAIPGSPALRAECCGTWSVGPLARVPRGG